MSLCFSETSMAENPFADIFRMHVSDDCFQCISDGVIHLCLSFKFSQGPGALVSQYAGSPDGGSGGKYLKGAVRTVSLLYVSGYCVLSDVFFR